MAVLLLVGKDTSEIEYLCREYSISYRSVSSDELPDPADVQSAWVSESVDASWLNAVWKSDARIILEAVLPLDLTAGGKRSLEFERLIVQDAAHPVSNGFGRMDLLDAHSADILLADSMPKTSRVIMSASRVAGFDAAEYGITEASYPAVVEMTPGKMICALHISQPIKRRYVPYARWKRLIVNLLAHITDSAIPTVPEYPDDVPLPFDREEERIKRYTNELNAAVSWYRNAGTLIEPDGSQGVLEGFTTEIDSNGNQKLRLHEGKPNERADCNIQSAFGFMAAGRALEDESISQVGTELFGFTCREFQSMDQSSFRGLWSWFRHGYESKVFYSDDNGWCGFFPLLWGIINNDDKAVSVGLETVVALKRTWGKNGHRRRKINWEDFFILNGRSGLRNESCSREVHASPHYESASMAAMALATWVTGDPSFLDCCRAGIDDYIEQWPHGITIQHSENDDGSKLLIAVLFAFLATGEGKFRDAVDGILKPFIDRQDPCGAIPEIDRTGKRFGLNKDNATYGTFESSIFHHDGDPVTDQIYGSTFMALALVFHGWIINEPAINTARDMLLDYLCNIQLAGTGKPFLDGSWMRSFDYQRWESFGAAGDWGWGPYAIETGWDVSIIMIATSFRLLNSNLLPDENRLRAYRPTVQSILREVETVHRELESDWRLNTPSPIARDQQRGPDLMI